MITTLNTSLTDDGQDLTDDNGVVRAIIRYIPDSAALGAWAVSQTSANGTITSSRARFDCLEACQFQALAWEANRLHRMARGSAGAELTGYEGRDVLRAASPLEAAITAVDQAADDMAKAKKDLARLTRPLGPETGG